MSNHYPAFGICGFSGSGKTTVIEKVVGILTERGLKVAVIKHDGHGLNIDREGKDTDRFFKAGGDVVITGPEQSFLRTHEGGNLPLSDMIKLIGPHYDLVLVEGHKSMPMEQKVWFCSDAGENPPPESASVLRVLKREEDRVQIVMEMIDEWLPRAWNAVSLYAGILIGGKSSRFGSPKHLVADNGETWLERTFQKVKKHIDNIVILGAGTIPDVLGGLPVLCDVSDAVGPLAGMRAAMRWNPQASWVFLSCDLPLLSEDAIRWLLEKRKSGVWVIQPQLPQAPAPEPLLAYYDFRSAPLLERVRRPLDLVNEDRVINPEIPEDIQSSWTNINTLDDLAVAKA